MARIFNRVKFNVSGTPGTGAITVGTRTASTFFLPTEAGAVDGNQTFFIAVKGNGDEQTCLGTLSSSATILSVDAVLQSIIAGVAGTTAVSLDATTTIAFVAPAEAFRTLRDVITVTGATDALADADGCTMTLYNSASAVAASLAQAGASNSFRKGWFKFIKNINDGLVTVTPTTSTINGVTTLNLYSRQTALIVSDGTNYQATVFGITGATVLGSELTIADWSADQNNLAVTSPNKTTTYHIGATVAANITGIVAGQSGQAILLINEKTPAITFKANSASSSAANQLQLPTDVTLSQFQSLLLVYDGTNSRWKQVAGSGSGGSNTAAFITYRFIATAGQTIFSGADQNGLTLLYTIGNVDMTVNGSKETPVVDFTASNGSSVTHLRAGGLSVGDEVLITAYQVGSASALNVSTEYLFNGVAGQTVFTGADANGKTLACNGWTKIFVDGIRVPFTDYALTSTNVTLNTALLKASVVTIETVTASQTTIGNVVQTDMSQQFTTAQKLQARQNIDVGIRGQLWGLTLSTAGSSATFSVTAGETVDNTNNALMTLTSALSKTTGSWAVGSTNGGLDTGTIANSTWYHAYLIKRIDTGVVDVVFSLNATAPTVMPANYTLSRRLGAMLTDSSAHWLSFSQNGDDFTWTVAIRDVNTSGIGTTATDYTLSVPTGLQVTAKIWAWIFNTGTSSTGCIYPKSMTDQTVTYGVFGNIKDPSAGNGAAAPMNILTDTSAKVRARGAAAGTTFDVDTIGWIDRRGRDN